MLALYMNDEKTAELQFEVAAQVGSSSDWGRGESWVDREFTVDRRTKIFEHPLMYNQKREKVQVYHSK